jgi:hypothetical protein
LLLKNTKVMYEKTWANILDPIASVIT